MYGSTVRWSVRTVAVVCATLPLLAAACASAPNAGALGEGFDLHPAITAVDSAIPPHSAWIDLDKQQYVVLLLVTPGRGVTILYPRDTIVDNRLSAGAHELTFVLTSQRAQIAQVDSLNRMRRRTSAGDDSLRRGAERGARGGAPATYQPYLLLVASPQPLSYARIRDKISGVSIPIDEMEALNAVSKTVKATLTTEPREWASYYRAVNVTPNH
jgi:hypothetical protein